MTPALQDVSVRQLQYVTAVADTLGFHRAAAQCHVSQPTLSAQIQQLEHVLGITLFERDHRRVLVTPAGKEIVMRARRILVELGDLLDAAGRERDPFKGTLRIGIIPTVAPYLLPEITPAAAATYPELRLALREEKTEHVLAQLREGKIDAGILVLMADLGSHLAHAVIGEDPFVVALPHGHPLARKKRLEMRELEGHEVLLLDDGHCFRTQALALCSKVGAREADLRATSLGTLVQMVSNGVGITLLPAMAVPVENRRAQLEVRPLAPPVPHRAIALVWRPESPLGNTLRALAKVFRAARQRSEKALDKDGRRKKGPRVPKAS
ncbi:MAG: LysR substrate-binding domain-containing protein [Polyangiaceae bacterium]|nr:LysR substrate-binding domain-containing protein [Polyangiaceae bacterium]